MRLFNGLEKTDYQDTLRAVGRLCDANGWRNLRIVECDEGLILQYTIGASSREFATYLLSDEDLQAMLRESYTHRRNHAFPRSASILRSNAEPAEDKSTPLNHEHEE
jgi:hypothetical protein